jgi:hypothetical protein
MATSYHSGLRAVALALFSFFGVGAVSLAQASTHFAGPRNTIPQTQGAKLAPIRPMQLLASRDAGGRCQLVHRVHHGHPGKGVDRIQRIDVPCEKARLSAR